MKLLIFSVHDSKAGAFIAPYYAGTFSTGIRAFQNACNDPNSIFCTNPGDFTLFELGTFDPETAKIEVKETATNHGLAVQYKNPTEARAEYNQKRNGELDQVEANDSFNLGVNE